MIYKHIYKHQKRQDRNEIKIKVKCMILISPCCYAFENAMAC